MLFLSICTIMITVKRNIIWLLSHSILWTNQNDSSGRVSFSIGISETRILPLHLYWNGVFGNLWIWISFVFTATGFRPMTNRISCETLESSSFPNLDYKRIVQQYDIEIETNIQSLNTLFISDSIGSLYCKLFRLNLTFSIYCVLLVWNANLR